MRDALIAAMARAMESYYLEYVPREAAEVALDAALSLLEKPDEDMIIAAINHRDEMDYSGVFVAMLNTLKTPA